MHGLLKYWRDLEMKPQGITLVIALFLPTLAIMAMFPIVASLIEHFKDDPDAAVKVPAMVTSPGYTIALLAPFAGLLADRFGRRPLLLVCTFFYGLVGAAPFLMKGLDPIIASRLALGIFEAGILTIVNTLIADYWDDRGRRNWLMLSGLSGPIFQPIAFFLVSLGAAVRWNGGFLVYLVAIPVFVAMYLYIYEPKGQRQNCRETEESPALGGFPIAVALVVAAVTLFTSIIYFVMIVYGSVIWRDLGVTSPLDVTKYTAIPVWFVLVGTAMFRFLSRYGIGTQFTAMFAFFAVGLAGISLAGSVLEMQIAFAVQQIGAGMAVPTLIAWAQSKFSFDHRGRGMGTWTCAFFLGQAISPILTGYAAGMIGGIHSSFLLAAGLSALGALFALLVAFRPR